MAFTIRKLSDLLYKKTQMLEDLKEALSILETPDVQLAQNHQTIDSKQ